MRDCAIRSYGARLIGETNDSSDRVENVDDEQAKDYEQCLDGEKAVEVEVAKHGTDALWHRNGQPVCGDLGYTHWNTSQGSQNNGIEESSLDSPGHHDSAEKDGKDA